MTCADLDCTQEPRHRLRYQAPDRAHVYDLCEYHTDRAKGPTASVVRWAPPLSIPRTKEKALMFDRCWILQDSAGHHYSQSRVAWVVTHFPTQAKAADHGRYWAPGCTPAQLPYRCHLLACACDAPDVLDDGCVSPDHPAEGGCISLMHGRDEEQAIERARADFWEEATTDGDGQPLLMCSDCA